MEQLQGLEIVRAMSAPVRAVTVDGVMPLMEVRFSPFDVWYEIDSWWEGRFLECTKRGAFAKTIKESRDSIKSLYDHGYDPQIGNKVLGAIEDLREDPETGAGDVRLFDTTYVRDLLPGLEAGVYGSSMRMRVIKEEWNDDPGVSDHNPLGLPERTILEARLFEFGPVTWPANPDATAGVRSATDDFIERLRSRDPQKVDELTRAREARTPDPKAAGSATAPAAGAARTTADEPGESHSGRITRAQRRERLSPILTPKGTTQP
jgi:HK97 family phage prohead protease